MENIRENNMKGAGIDSLISHIFKLWQKSRRRILDELGLSISQYEILSAIYFLRHYQKEIIQIDLSEETGIDPMTTSNILRRLEENDMITRVRGTVNTRVVYIDLTGKGNSTYKMVASKIERCYNAIYRNIDEKKLTDQLLVLSNELNKLNNK